MDLKDLQDQESLKKQLLEKFEESRDVQAILTLAWLFDLMSMKDNDEEFERLIERDLVLDCVNFNPNLFYSIIATHSSWDNYLKLATALSDHERIIQHYMDTSNYEQALKSMLESKKNELIYKHGHFLMKALPEKTVDLLIKSGNLESSKLIPILIQERSEHACENTIRYLEHCIKIQKSQCKLLHNHLFELYAKYRNEDTLIDFLNTHAKSDDSNFYYLDLHFCYRICSQLKLNNARVILCSLMDLYEEAVSLALEFNVELAKQIAKQPESMEQRKRLWIEIAEKILSKNRSIENATALLSEYGLKIEDILPFFPEYSTIDSFKDAIQKSLNEYKKEITELKNTSFDDIAVELLEGIKDSKNRCTVIKMSQNCEVCGQRLSRSSFLVFPCGHFFHKHCQANEIMLIDPSLDTNQDECINCSCLLIDYVDRLPTLRMLTD